MKKHNFNAGPSILPREVIEKAAAAVLDFDGTRQKFLETERANLAIKKADKPVDKRLVPYNLSERARQINMMQ